jgi:hypothetical protein
LGLVLISKNADFSRIVPAITQALELDHKLAGILVYKTSTTPSEQLHHARGSHIADFGMVFPVI